MSEGKRLLSVADAMNYTGLGKSSVYKLGAEIGCIVKYGTRTFFDREKIDAAIDNGVGFQTVRRT